MTETANPYQPPETVSSLADFHGRLRFSGTMEADDYFELLPINSVERFGWLVFESPLLTLIIPTVMAATVHDLAKNSSYDGLLTVVSFVCVLVLSIMLQRSYSRRAVTAKQLKQNPDLLGIAQGEATADGLLFYDGLHHYWFGPSALRDCIASRRGLRVRAEKNPFRFLALTARMFGGYDVSTAKRLVESWKKSSATGKTPSWQLWEQVGQAPDQAIQIRYTIPVNSVSTQAFPPPIGMWDLVSVLFLVGVTVFLGSSIGKWILLAYFIFLAFSILIWTPLMRRWLRDKPTPEFTQYAWITADDFATYNQLSGLRLPTSRLELRQENDELIVGTLQGQIFHIPLSTLDDPNDWQRLCSIVKARALEE